LDAACEQAHLSTRDVAQVAKEEVLKLWGRPVKAFIPVLAYRAARDRVCPTVSSVPPAVLARASAADEPGEPRRGGRELTADTRVGFDPTDTLDLANDVLDLSDEDISGPDETCGRSTGNLLSHDNTFAMRNE
jgi:hypothetical protein